MGSLRELLETPIEPRFFARRIVCRVVSENRRDGKKVNLHGTMNEKRFDLVGIGSMVVDLIYRTPRIIGSEEKIALDRYGDGTTTQMLVGGVTLNHLSWAGLLGLRVGIFGKQGEDEYGRF